MLPYNVLARTKGWRGVTGPFKKNVSKSSIYIPRVIDGKGPALLQTSVPPFKNYKRGQASSKHQVQGKDFETSAHSEGSLGTYRISLLSSSHIKETRRSKPGVLISNPWGRNTATEFNLSLGYLVAPCLKC